MTKPETVPHQALAEAIASIVCAAIAARFFRREKPAAGGEVVAREFLRPLSDFVQIVAMPAARRWFDEHVQSVAAAVIDDIESRGVPHSFVAPTWNHDGAEVLGDHVTSVGSDGPVVRVVVFQDATQPQIAVMWSARFAAAGSPVPVAPA